MLEISSLRDGFAIDDTVHEVYRKLAKDRDLSSYQPLEEENIAKRTTKESDFVSVPFSTMKDVFIWAACLGFQKGLKKPILGKRRMIFRWAQCTPQTDIPILKAIAIADSGDVNILLKLNEVRSIAEEYANAGIHDLRDSVLEGKDLPLWNLVYLI